MRARVEEIVRCDTCGGLIAGPQDFGVALCHCPKPKSSGKAVSGNVLSKLTRARQRREREQEPAPRLDEPIATLAWDTLPPHDK